MQGPCNYVTFDGFENGANETFQEYTNIILKPFVQTDFDNP